ncbi:hypothetical protein VCHA53O466_40471 [Vibrio chagasii]|nr:hypothetical protein VCHA53O466_40471 [Vibrio chagasii]
MSNVKAQSRPSNITLVQLSDSDGILNNPYVVTSNSTNLAADTEISIETYKKEVQSQLNIKPIDAKRHDEFTGYSHTQLSNGLPIDLIYIYASSEHGLMLNLNTFGEHEFNTDPEFNKKVKSAFEDIALKTGGFVEFDVDDTSYDLNVWFPESLLKEVNTHDGLKQFIASDNWG